MLKSLRGLVMGSLSLSLMFINTVFWAIPIYLTAFLKLIVPLAGWRKLCSKVLLVFSTSWISCNNLNLRVFNGMKWTVEGVDALDMNDWYLVLSNHQTWVDIIVLQKVFNRKIPFLKFFIKKELLWVPILGLAWWALDYPVMMRYSKEFIKKNPHLKGKDVETTRKSCEKFKTMPVSIMNFVEGTRFTAEKHDKQKSPHKHLLKPRAAGVASVLNIMGDQINRILDVTIIYPRGARSFWRFLCGDVDEVVVKVESLPVSEELIGDYYEDDQFRERFNTWINSLWDRKDKVLDNIPRG